MRGKQPASSVGSVKIQIYRKQPTGNTVSKMQMQKDRQPKLYSMEVAAKAVMEMWLVGIARPRIQPLTQLNRIKAFVIGEPNCTKFAT